MDLKQQLAYAIKLAATEHYGQFDKGGQPYILHCLKVMHYLKDYSVEVQIAGVLHDIVEDTDITLDFLSDQGINALSLEIIDRMTKKSGQTPEEYVGGILKHYQTCLVKRADLRHNTDVRRLKGLEDKDLLRMRKYHGMFVKINHSIRLHEQIALLGGDN